MPKLIIALAGTLGAGKGTASAYLKTKYGADVIMFSDVFRSILRILAIETSRQSIGYLSGVLREAYGQDVLAHAVRHSISLSERPIIVLDGAHRIQDLQPMADMEGFHVLFIDAPQELRYKRIVARGQNRGDNEKTYEDFLKDEEGEADRDIRTLIAYSEQVIQNETTEVDLYQAIDAFVARMRK